jgi:hypothetical protein
LFGSYVTSEDDPIGDVDVTVRLEMVHRFDESLQASADKKRMAIARAAGRRFSTDVDRFFWLQTEVTRYLKGRSPILDFTTFEDAAVTKALKTGACRKLAVSSALSNSPTSSYVSLDDITRHLQELGRDADRGDTMLSNDARNYLQIASECLGDSAADAAADTAQRSDFIELYLPAVFSKRYDAAFFERFRPVFREIATQVSRSPSKLLLPTTAHEIAFSLMIDYAKSAAQTDVTDSVFSSNMTLRRFGDLRDELDRYFEEICLDTDFEMLYDLPLARSLLQSKKACEDADIVSMDLAEWFEVFCGPNDVPYSIDGREQVLGRR